MLKDNLITYLSACNDQELISWVNKNVFFPCSMVDRITPQTSNKLKQELSELLGSEVYSPIMAEDFSQWVLQDISNKCDQSIKTKVCFYNCKAMFPFSLT